MQIAEFPVIGLFLPLDETQVFFQLAAAPFRRRELMVVHHMYGKSLKEKALLGEVQLGGQVVADIFVQ